MRAVMKLRSLILGVLLLALAGGQSEAALSGSEKKAYDSAAEAFRIGFWDRAEVEFAEFIEKHPKSERLGDAILLQAQAQFQQKKYASAVALLTAREADAGPLADQFLYWIAEAEYQNGNYRAAADSFGKLAREYRTSPRRLEAAVGEAAAQARLGEWAKVLELLRKPESAFRQSALGVTNNETVARGYLLQAEAHLAEKRYPEAEATLNKIGPELRGELDWRRRNVLCRALLASNRPDDAERESAGLLTAAEATRRPDLISESVVLRANILEQLGSGTRPWPRSSAISAPNSPAAQQEQALSRITTLALEQGQYEVALATLQPLSRPIPRLGTRRQSRCSPWARCISSSTPRCWPRT